MNIKFLSDVKDETKALWIKDPSLVFFKKGKVALGVYKGLSKNKTINFQK
jgi:hypothetical protein